MDLDFPLILTWAVLVTGAIWLFDVVALKPRRIEARDDDAEKDVEPLIVEYNNTGKNDRAYSTKRMSNR